MQELIPQNLKKTAKILKSYIKNNILDIFIIGSSLKNKIAPNDLDIIVLFKEKNLKQIEEDFYNIKENLIFIKEVHIEPLFISSIFSEKVLKTILHEGFSIKYSKFLSQLTNLNSFAIFSFNLENLNKIDKVRFAQTLYGRKKDGILYKNDGISLGQGSFMIPIQKEEIFKELMKKWKISYLHKRAFVSD